MQRLWPALALATLLAACGGGGGGPATSAPATAAALTFTPAQVTASAPAGTSATVNVSASVNRPADFDTATVFASIVDSTGVLLPNIALVRDSDQAYHATLQTAPTLAAGSYQGNFTVRLCRDSGCASQFPGSPMQLPYSFQVTPAGSAPFAASSASPLSATMHQGGAAPAAASVSIQSGGRSWSAASGASWLVPSRSSGSGDATISLSYAAAGLAPATYNTTFTLTAGDGQVVTLPVALTVLAPAFQVSSDGVVFTAINGAPIAPQSLQFAIDNAQATRWDASSSAGWLRVTPSQGYTPATMSLAVDPTVGPLASGSYNATLALSANAVTPRSVPVKLNLVKATLQSASASVNLGGSYGRDFQPQTLTLNLNTGAAAWPWSLSTMPAWASASATAGTVGGGGTAIVFTPNPAQAPAGSSSTQMTALAQVNGDLVGVQLKLNINKDRHKLLAAETGVALSSSPSWSRLVRTIAISDNYGLTPDWTVVTDQAWLTASGNGASLTVTADPTSLTANTLSYATVTLTSTDATVTQPVTIKVALWKGASSPAASVSPHPLYSNVVADPIRPLVYAHNGGLSVDVYNVYTGLLSDTLTGFSAALGDMAVSADGSLLYVYDLSNSKIEVRNLPSKTVQVRWALPRAPDRTSRLALLQPNGVPLLALNDGSIYSAGGTFLTRLPIQGGTLSASADGKRLYVQDEGGATVHLSTYTIDYAELAGGTLFAAQLPAATRLGNGAAGQDIAASADGKFLYAASGTPTQCSVLGSSDLGTLSYLGSGGMAPDNIEIGSDGRVYCGVGSKSASTDVWVYSAAGGLLKQLKFVPLGRQLAPRQMVVSGDGFLLIGLGDDGALNIVPVGP